ncbi:MAG: 2-hydroxyacid dehydrogenase, partial [Acidimicrobiia bacterium]|nr:2-hydroxyacid dehydrogenase [Acidimicrobiia bacterium]
MSGGRVTEIAFFSAKTYERQVFDAANAAAGNPHHLVYLENRLELESVGLAMGAPTVCVFVNDVVSAPVIEALAAGGTRCIALRCAGFNNVDLEAAERLGVTVVRVPSYSPNAVAEHTLALILTLTRRIHLAYNRVRDGNFALDGLVGF